MTIPTTDYSALPGGNFPASDWDTSFSQVAALGNIFCACTGVNSLTLTPAATSPPVTAYQQGQVYTFFAASNNTGAVTAAVGGGGFVGVYTQGGVQISAANSIQAGSYFQLVYDGALNSNAGGLMLASFLAGSSSVSAVTAGDTSLTITPTTGSVVANLNVANANTWTAAQQFVLTGAAIQVSSASSSAATSVNFYDNSFGIASWQVGKDASGNFAIYDLVNSATAFQLSPGGATSLAPHGGGITAGSTITMSSGTVTGLPTPVASTDAVPKSYVDSAVVNTTYHTPVALSTAAALAANTYNNGSSGVGATLTGNSDGALSVDSTVVTSAQRILVSQEATPANNGIYTVTTVGDGSHAYVLTRATDANSPGTGSTTQIGDGTFVFVQGGSTLTGTGWVVNSTVTTIGTSAINWVQISATLSGVATISNSDGSLTVSPTSGAPVASLNVAHANTWTATQTVSGNNIGIVLNGTGGGTAPLVLKNAGTQNFQIQVDTSNNLEVVNFVRGGNDVYITNNGNMNLMGAGGGTSIGATSGLTIPSGGLAVAGPASFFGGIPWADVMAYGALGNNSHNDATNIQNAINHMNSTYGGGYVFFPPGNYKVTTGISVPGSIILVGAGQNASAINGQASNIITCTFTAAAGYGGARDLAFYGYTGVNTKATVLISGNGPALTFQNCTMIGGYYGLQVAATDCQFLNCYITCNSGGGYGVISEGANWWERCKFDLAAGPNALGGFYQGEYSFGGLCENHFTDCDFSGAYNNSLIINDGGTGTNLSVFKSCIFASPIAIQASKGTSMVGCEIASAFQSINGGLSIVGCICPSGVINIPIAAAQKVANQNIT